VKAGDLRTPGSSGEVTLRTRIVLFGVVMTAALVTIFVVLAMLEDRQERALGEAIQGFSEEQRLSDQMGRAVMLQILRITDLDQDLAGVPSPAGISSQGDEVHRTLRLLLDRPLSPEERSTLERLRETHEVVETAAARAGILSRLGEGDAAAAARAETARLALQFLAEVERFSELRAEELDRILEEQARTFQLLLLFRLGVVVVFLFLAITLAASIYRRLTASLDTLLEASARLGKGDLSARVPPARDPEFGAVARGFNQMADQLSQAQVELERRNGELADALAEVRQAQGEVIQAEKLAALGRMAAGLAHELNNPLGAVLGFAQLLDERLQESGAGVGDEKERELIRREFLRPIMEESRRSRDLIQTILQFTRRKVATSRAVPVQASLEEAATMLAPSFAAADVILEVAGVPDVWIAADPRLLESVFVNLAGNARDAMEGVGGRRLRVQGHLEAASGDGEILVLGFEDEGPGFSEPHRAFEPFYTTKAPGKGTGLGLPLVHRFVEAFGGSVNVENRSVGGARVELRIPTVPAPSPSPSAGEVPPPPAPLTRARPSPAPPAPHAVAPASGPDGVPATVSGPFPSPPWSPEPPAPPGLPSGGPRSAAGPLSVLVVDDEPALRRLQARILRRMGANAMEAGSVGEAQAILMDAEVQAVVSDVRMPGGSGVELYRWICDRDPALASRFLFITGDLSHPELAAIAPESSRELPFQREVEPGPALPPVLLKPFSTDDFRNAVAGLLDRREEPPAP
jgi:signal transduction histidine kinase